MVIMVPISSAIVRVVERVGGFEGGGKVVMEGQILFQDFCPTNTKKSATSLLCRSCAAESPFYKTDAVLQSCLITSTSRSQRRRRLNDSRNDGIANPTDSFSSSSQRTDHIWTASHDRDPSTSSNLPLPLRERLSSKEHVHADSPLSILPSLSHGCYATEPGLRLVLQPDRRPRTLVRDR